MTMSIADQFHEFFRFRVADTPQLKQQCARLRYQVYARELGWEPLNDQELETDMYDALSVHCLLEHIPSGSFAGTVRLILPSEVPAIPLPVEDLCNQSFYPEISRPSEFVGSQVAEISRLAVPLNFRRRLFEKEHPFLAKDIEGKSEIEVQRQLRQFPLIAVGLYVGLLALCKRMGLVRVFALMESRLMKRLSRLGLNFEQLGNGVCHKGIRVPYGLNVYSAAAGFKPEMLALYDLIDAQITHQSGEGNCPQLLPESVQKLAS